MRPGCFHPRNRGPWSLRYPTLGGFNEAGMFPSQKCTKLLKAYADELGLQ